MCILFISLFLDTDTEQVSYRWFISSPPYKYLPNTKLQKKKSLTVKIIHYVIPMRKTFYLLYEKYVIFIYLLL